MILSFGLLLAQATFSQTITNAWVKRPIPGVKLTGAYMLIENKGSQPFSLLKVQGPDADFYEIHTHEKKDGVMKMRQLQSLEIPANSKVELKPKSFHIMLIQVKKNKLLPETKSTSLTLLFSNKKEVTVKAQVLNRKKRED
jgi:copper(I)-binding protein